MGRICVTVKVNTTFPSAPSAIFALLALKDLATAVLKIN
jgi:hypothetical protein